MAPKSFIIKDVRIFDGENVIPTGYVHVSNGEIASVGHGSPSSSVLSENVIISKPGHTVVPGLIDAHNHCDKGNTNALYQGLRFGVTTIMDLHNEIPNCHKLKKIAKEEVGKAADFKCAGVAATIDNGWPQAVVTLHDKSEETAAEIATWPKLKTEEDVKAYIKQNIANGADYIKLMHESGAAMGAEFSKPTVELQKYVINEAHAAGKVAIAHSLAMADTIEMLDANIDGMAHASFDQAPTKELIDAYKRRNAWLNPTLAAIGSLTKEGQETAERFAHDKRVEGKIGKDELCRLCQCMGFSKETSKVEYAYESVRQLKAARIDIICGSDSAGPALGTAWGLSLHHELFLFVDQCGFTPLEALKSATSVTAKRFGFADRGRIAEGLKADLVLIEGNPVEDIDATLNLRAVWRDGVLGEWYEGKV
ncbi:hypothetical protein EJ08DRAFT_652011 [Tothia fuscella]|uniref:Amidohydrolase-related domain-containing protein n=1 Tax=Tothia fuscella TaxID=1048955 RepID=A0A9P4NL24_9PEZI|nr:hypothetical protein EJ08DRAFT_652011 [Tothia fuscella]